MISKWKYKFIFNGVAKLDERFDSSPFDSSQGETRQLAFAIALAVQAIRVFDGRPDLELAYLDSSDSTSLSIDEYDASMQSVSILFQSACNDLHKVDCGIGPTMS